MATHVFASIPQFVAFLAGVSASLPPARKHALETGCRIIQTEAKRVLGTYDYGWVQLAPFTKAQRVRLGFPENEPGLRTGDMRESIKYVVTATGLFTHEGQVGSNSDKLVWFELGTRTQPPRPVLLQAAMRKADEVEQTIGRTIAMVFDSGGFSSKGHAFNTVHFTIP